MNRPTWMTALATLAAMASLQAQQGPAPLPTLAAKRGALVRHEGFVPFVLEPRTGQLWLELPASGLSTLQCLTLATGLGSNPVGLDRGASGTCNVATFMPIGGRMLMELENTSYRSTFANNPDHARSVAEAFPPSTVAALPIIAEEGGRVLVDATEMLLRDWMDAVGTLEATGQGAYTLSRDRSYVYEPSTRAYPRNTELEAALTFEAKGKPGRIVEQIVPDGRAFTLREHMTFAELPDAGYRPRDFDPRMSFYGPTFKDYAQPMQAPLERRWISRFRLERVNPADPASPIKNPIVYYIDRGIPEPLRTASLEGARFWSTAFDRAGLVGGFKVDLLPEGADPMDIRYNVVQWENRNERGWSIGGGLSDPRTGQILKGMARMDSHRGRTSYNIIAALTGAVTAADTHFVLGRVRQVTAHEIGHTLGMAHNYIASTYGRGSVMDYPAPRITLDAAGNVDIAEAYDLGPGAYDVLAIRWGYGIFPPEHEADSLKAIVAEGLAKGLLFLTDADARPDFASDPRVTLWDDLATPEAFLKMQLAVRRTAIGRFGLANIRAGEPVATLQERFVPLYFFHRFAAGAVAKVIGGVEYHNAVAGDGQQETKVVAAARQRAAVAQLLATLYPAELTIPDTVRTLLGPRPFGYEGSVELFGSQTRPTFDEFGAARTLAQMILDAMLQRDRLARVVEQSAHDPGALGLPELLATIKASVWDAPASRNGQEAGLRRAVQRALVARLLALAADQDAAPDVTAQAEEMLGQLRTEAVGRSTAAASSREARAHFAAIASDITHWKTDRALPEAPPLPAPPGDPFGEEDPT